MAKLTIEHYMATEADWRASFACEAVIAAAVAIHQVAPEDIEADLITWATPLLDVAASGSDGRTEVRVEVEHGDLPWLSRNKVTRLHQIGHDMHHILMDGESVQMVPMLGRALLANELIIWPTPVALSGWNHRGSGRKVFRKRGDGRYDLNVRPDAKHR